MIKNKTDDYEMMTKIFNYEEKRQHDLHSQIQMFDVFGNGLRSEFEEQEAPP